MGLRQAGCTRRGPAPRDGGGMPTGPDQPGNSRWSAGADCAQAFFFLSARPQTKGRKNGRKGKVHDAPSIVATVAQFQPPLLRFHTLRAAAYGAQNFSDAPGGKFFCGPGTSGRANDAVGRRVLRRSEEDRGRPQGPAREIRSGDLSRRGLRLRMFRSLRPSARPRGGGRRSAWFCRLNRTGP